MRQVKIAVKINLFLRSAYSVFSIEKHCIFSSAHCIFNTLQWKLILEILILSILVISILPFCRPAVLPSAPPPLLIDILLPFWNPHSCCRSDATFPFFLDKCCDWKSMPTTTTTTYLFLELWAELAAKRTGWRDYLMKRTTSLTHSDITLFKLLEHSVSSWICAMMLNDTTCGLSKIIDVKSCCVLIVFLNFMEGNFLSCRETSGG